MDHEESKAAVNFIQEIINQDNKTNKHHGRVHLRFPPEPNGYLHIGHAKSICLNFGLAAQNGGLCNLRFDDTNPNKEDVEYIDSIINDVRWLGFDWDDRLFYASDYFEKMYDYAVSLIKAGKAYVCDLSPEETRNYRGTFKEPGRESPYRNRSVEENLDLFRRMRAGEFPDGSRVLRAKIDMSSPNPGREINGVFILCTTMPIPLRIITKRLPILFVPWSSKTIALYMIGFSML